MRSWHLLLVASFVAAAASSCQSASSGAGPPRLPLEHVTTTSPATTSLGDGTLRSSPPQAKPPSGFYVDGPDGTPHYVLTISDTPTGFTGWMFFVYQDGQISETFHYHSSALVPDLLLSVGMVTDTATDPFPYQHVAPGSLPGSQPIGPGRTFSGTYGTIGTTALRLSNCDTYLYWANPANISRPMSCSFTYSGTNTW